MNKRRILFVDDEPNVLEGLRNLLRKQRHVWDMRFAVSGADALEQLAREPVDVVVSDMRMPGMDGVELLTRVKETHPETARIVLSGHAERDAIAQVVSVAHQFLSKPSDATTVRTVIERTSALQVLMQDAGIRRVAGALNRLPSLPATYWELTRATQDPDTSIADIAKIVESDPAMSAKVLQLVSSAYFGLAQKTESISKAVTYLGIENLKGLLVAAHVFGASDAPVVNGLSMADMRDDAMLTASLARRIVRDRKQADAAFAAGIMHDIGQLVLARDPSKQYGDVLREARETGVPVQDVEKKTTGATHGAVGAYLLGVWGLPFTLAEAVAFHDTPAIVVEGNADVLAAVHLAHGLAQAASAKRDAVATGTLDMAFLDRAGLTAEIPKWRATAEEAVAPRAR